MPKGRRHPPPVGNIPRWVLSALSLKGNTIFSPFRRCLVCGAVTGRSAVICWYATRAMKRAVLNGLEGMIGEIGEASDCGSRGLLVQA